MTDTFTCKHCRKQFKFETIEGLPFRLSPNICDPCDERMRQQESARRVALQIAVWEGIRPDYCKDTDRNHPHLPSAQKQQRIDAWAFGPRGLVLHGTTRRCKTRCAWLLLKRLMIEGKNIEAVTSIGLSDALANMWSAGAEHVVWYKDRLVDADVLLVDDLGKCKMTERAEADLFDIFDRRFSRSRPIIITTNFVGDKLAEKFSPDRGAPFVARLREFCDAINL